MNKCDFCPHSRLENGKLVCPYSICWLSKKELKEIYEMMKSMKR